MNLWFPEINKNQFFFVICLGCIIFNIIIYKNYNFTIICLAIYVLYKHNCRLSKKKNTMNGKDLSYLMDKYEREHYVNPSDNILLNTVPRKFKYIFIKPTFLQPIHELRFIKQYSNEIIPQMIVILERFLKIFYNILSERYSKKYNLDHMKDLHREMQKIQSVAKMNVPRYSTNIHRFGNVPLYEVIDKNFSTIAQNMKKKIDIVLSLVNEKKLNL